MWTSNNKAELLIYLAKLFFRLAMGTAGCFSLLSAFIFWETGSWHEDDEGNRQHYWLEVTVSGILYLLGFILIVLSIYLLRKELVRTFTLLKAYFSQLKLKGKEGRFR